MNRTNTTSQSFFSLPSPASVSFDFSVPNHMLITIPPLSTWRIKQHWHQQDLGCKSIQTLHGQIVLWRAQYPTSGFPTIGGGISKIFKAKERVGWWPQDWPHDKNSLVVILNAGESLYRNTCSSTLDAERVPHLRTTPLWLRLIFTPLAPWPSAYRWLIHPTLWVQIQAMNHAHGYYDYHGALRLVERWAWLHPLDWKAPPNWVQQLEWKSQFMISRVVQALSYWVARLFLGMKG